MALDKFRDDGADFSGYATELTVHHVSGFPFDMNDQDLSDAAPGQFTHKKADCC